MGECLLGEELTAGPTFLHMLDRRRCLRALARVSTPHARPTPIDDPVEKLSRGQQQVMAIARASAWGSKLILMDRQTPRRFGSPRPPRSKRWSSNLGDKV